MVRFLLASLILMAGSLPAEQQFGKDDQARFRAYVDKIAYSLEHAAVLRDASPTWEVVPAEGKPRVSIDFYEGDCGVAYFFYKAYALTRNLQYLEIADRVMAGVAAHAKLGPDGTFFNPSTNGVFNGNAGPAYVNLYAFSVTRDKKYLTAAEDVARYIVAHPDLRERSSLDIIAGGAGTGLFLLKLDQVTHNADYKAAAVKLGEHIIAAAEPQAHGAKWKVGGGDAKYYFVGFSHGPAGIGYFLDRLYQSTGDARFRDYAAKALDHVEHIAIPEKNYVKWYHEELARQTRFSSQWCHGNPGMLPFFLLHYDVTHDKDLLDWSDKTAAFIIDQGLDVRKNASVCHGISGNSAALYQLYMATAKPEYFAQVREGIRLLDATVKEDGKQIYWEVPGSKVDYSYMTGLAGVGDFYAMIATNGKLNMMGVLGYGDDIPVSPPNNARK